MPSSSQKESFVTTAKPVAAVVTNFLFCLIPWAKPRSMNLP